MALWGKNDQYSDAPKFTAKAESGASGQEQYGNTVFGVDATEAQVARADDKGGVTPGWNKVTTGTGGRAGRVTHEALVAFSNDGFKNAEGVREDATDFANTAAEANTSGTADDATFPDA